MSSWWRDFAGGKNLHFFYIPDDSIDVKLPPGFSARKTPTAWSWIYSAITLRHVWASPNTVWSVIALIIYFWYAFLFYQQNCNFNC